MQHVCDLLYYKLYLKTLHMVLVFMSVVMAAEVVKHFFPKLVELHNYTPAHSTHQKLSNWNTLNRQANIFQADGNKYHTLLI